jgi:hypothetical protein
MRALWQDPSMREHFKEHHDHRTGTCDLDVFLEAFLHGTAWVRTGCYVQWWSHLRTCACPLCSGQASRKRARRQDRHDTRRVLHDAAAQFAAADLDEDLPGARRPTAW